jgi:hypothetical protein
LPVCDRCELLGRRVRIKLDNAVIVTGIFLGYGQDGTVEILEDDGFVHYCWPLLEIEPDNGGSAGVREPRGDSPDHPLAGKPGLPGGSDDYETASPAGDNPWKFAGLSPLMVSVDCVNFHEVPDGADVSEFVRELAGK